MDGHRLSINQNPTIANLTNNRKQKTDSHNTDSFDDMLSIFVDGFGGMTSFAWSNNTPVAVFSYGGDLGFRWKYRAFSHSIPNGLFGDISVGYSHRGCNAFPIDYGTAHLKSWWLFLISIIKQNSQSI